MSFLLLLGISKEYGILLVHTHFPISKRFCIVSFTRLFTHQNDHHIDILGKGSHQSCKSLVFLALGVALQLVVSLLMFAVITTTMAITITLHPVFVQNALLGRGELHLFFRCVADKGHLKIVPFIILGFEGLRGTTANASNIKLVIDLLIRSLIHHVLTSGN